MSNRKPAISSLIWKITKEFLWILVRLDKVKILIILYAIRA
jgi:hypothetical protein